MWKVELWNISLILVNFVYFTPVDQNATIHFYSWLTFYDSKFYQSDNAWGVLIIQLKEQKLWSYGLSTETRTDLSRNIDALFREESNRLKESTSIASAFNLKTPEFEQLQSKQMSDHHTWLKIDMTLEYSQFFMCGDSYSWKKISIWQNLLHQKIWNASGSLCCCGF